MFVCKAEEGCQLTVKLDLELPIFRHEPDLFNQFAEAFRGLQAGILLVEGLGQVHDFLAVAFGEVRVKARQGRWCCFKLSAEFDAPSFQGDHLVLYSGARDT